MAKLVAPLTAEECRFGVIAVSTPREALFTRDDLAVVELLASQVAAALGSIAGESGSKASWGPAPL